MASTCHPLHPLRHPNHRTEGREEGGKEEEKGWSERFPTMEVVGPLLTGPYFSGISDGCLFPLPLQTNDGAQIIILFFLRTTENYYVVHTLQYNLPFLWYCVSIFHRPTAMYAWAD